MRDILKSFKSFITVLVIIITATLLFLAVTGSTVLAPETINTVATAFISVLTVVITFYFAKKDSDGGKEQKELMGAIVPELKMTTTPNVVDTTVKINAPAIAETK